jgi:glycosyltransferase involved in cell wall biosynthesis
MISVIICTYNPREEYLQRTISSVINQTLTPDEYELIVVDNNSQVNIAEFNISKESSIKLIKEPRQGLNYARECGAQIAQGDIIVFVDDDNLLNLNFLSVARSIFNQNSKIGVMSGQILPIYEKKPGRYFIKNIQNCLAIRSFPTDHLYLTSIPQGNMYFPIGAGMCIRKEILLEYYNKQDPKNEIIGRQGHKLTSGEDIDIDLFALSKGYLVGVTNKLITSHIIPRSRTRYSYIIKLKKAQMWSSLQITKKWLNIYNDIVFPDFKKSKINVLSKTIVSLFFYVFSPWKYGVMFHNNLNLLGILLILRKFKR